MNIIINACIAIKNNYTYYQVIVKIYCLTNECGNVSNECNEEFLLPLNEVQYLGILERIRNHLALPCRDIKDSYCYKYWCY